MMNQTKYNSKMAQVEDKQKEPFYIKLIPEIFRVRFEKQIVQLAIDEQRNMLYSLGIITEGQRSG